MANFDNSGLLKPNDKKESPSHSDLKGTLKINGDQHYLDGFVEDEKTVIKLSITRIEDRDIKGSGKIEKTDKAERKDTYPDYKGALSINDTEFWVSAWRKDPKGKIQTPWISLQIEPKDAPNTATAEEDDHSDLPF